MRFRFNRSWFSWTVAILLGIVLLLGADRSLAADNPLGTWTLLPDHGVGRTMYSAIWTGTNMLIWGGMLEYPPLPAYGGESFDPATGLWTDIASQNAPSGRWGQVSVWTGSEMLIWGGGNGVSTYADGGRYNPTHNEWTAISAENAPTSRAFAQVVWTGSEMIVYGGFSAVYHYCDDGARYSPATNTWIGVPAAGGPGKRSGASAVWTGRELIVWGGRVEVDEQPSGSYLNSGARYDPTSNTWTALTVENAPTARGNHVAVWTGTEMIVWGGEDGSGIVNNGARYDPVSDRWQAIPTGQPGYPPPLSQLRAIWAGSRVLILGIDSSGGSAQVNGVSFTPLTGTWQPLATQNAPQNFQSVVWTGTRLITWSPRYVSWRVYTGSGGILSIPPGPIYLPLVCQP